MIFFSAAKYIIKRRFFSILVFILARPTVSYSCSHQCFIEAPLMVSPFNGEGDVPRNAVISLRWFAPVRSLGGDPLAIGIRTLSGGIPVEADIESVEFANSFVTVVREIPRAILESDTDYEVFRAVDEPVVVIGTFRTGSQTDSTAPREPVLAANASGPESCLPEGSGLCCQPVEARLVTIAPLLTEPGTVFVLDGPSGRLASDITEETKGIVLSERADLDCTFSENPVFQLGLGGTYDLTVRARDRAGNESIPVVVTVDASISTGGACEVSRQQRPTAPHAASVLSIIIAIWVARARIRGLLVTRMRTIAVRFREIVTVLLIGQDFGRYGTSGHLSRNSCSVRTPILRRRSHARFER
jgi:hypothetical protein